MNVLENVNKSWLPFFEDNKDELKNILSNIDFDSKPIFPNKKDIFRALFYSDVTEIKLVLIGQDPYISSEQIHGIKVPQACGLSFSVLECHKKIPPSLVNIYKEIKSCYPELIVPKHGSLEKWATEENILLLNALLTVDEGKSNSHQKLWIKFTDKLIKFISNKNDKTIFLLMGNFAIGKSKLIDESKHKIFTSIHPSPLSLKENQRFSFKASYHKKLCFL